MRANCNFAVAAQYVDRGQDIFVHVLDELGDGFGEDGAVGERDGGGVGGGEGGDTGGSFVLFALARRERG